MTRQLFDYRDVAGTSCADFILAVREGEALPVVAPAQLHIVTTHHRFFVSPYLLDQLECRPEPLQNQPERRDFINRQHLHTYKDFCGVKTYEKLQMDQQTIETNRQQ